MAEPQSKKKNKKKKQSSGNTSSHPTAAPAHVSANLVAENNSSINEILPQEVGMKTMFKDVEVTLTQCNAKNAIAGNSGAKNNIIKDSSTGANDSKNAVANGSSGKKKKKKKKSKQQSPEAVQEPDTNESDTRDNLLNFSENHIELVNHPEISVTLSNLPQVKEKEAPPKPDEKVIPAPGEKETSETNTTSTGTKKKKKKKKKNSENNSVPPTITNPEEPVTSAPTYVKLPASGDSCVLLVSHESFSNGSKGIINNDTEKAKLPPGGGATVLIKNKNLIKNEQRNEVLKDSSSSFNSKIQIGNTVSIFPVATELKQDAPSQKGTDTNEVSLDKITTLVKNEINGNVIQDPLLTNSSNDVVSKTEETSLTKAQLKAERRAKQEAQRAAKSSEKVPSGIQNPKSDKCLVNAKDPPLAKQSVPQSNVLAVTKSTINASEKEVLRKVRLFSHLPQHKPSNIFFKETSNESLNIHPSVLEIGAQYSKGIVCGSNARCVGLLAAFRDVIRDYKTPPNKKFARELESKLQTYLNFLSNCRPLSVSMGNAVKFLKHQINHIPPDMEEEKAKEKLCTFISSFVRDEILLANEAIGNSASAKIIDGDVILVFSYSSLVKDVLCKAYNQNKIFQVVVVDSRPKLEGLKMLRCLVKQGLHCSYISINAISYVMKEVSKVIIGAHALLSNGCVMSRLGAKQVALVASSYSVPVLVCCETYKFCERVLTDSFVHNELGDPEDLVTVSLEKNDCLKDWQNLSSLQILNLLYDVTPSDLISMVITEKGVLPCTSVPVVLRVRHAGLHE